MLSYMIPAEDQAGKAPSAAATGAAAGTGMGSGGASSPQQQQPLIHKSRKQQLHFEPSSQKNGVVREEAPVNGQHSSSTTVVVNSIGGTTTTTTFSSTSNVNGAVHTTKKIIKTFREQPLGAVVGTGCMSTESSVSSLSTAASDAPGTGTGQAATPTSITSSVLSDKPKPKLLSNGTKNPGLKRVSFGSSKGSMVETLVYESPLHEEPELMTPTYEQPAPLLDPAILASLAAAQGADRVRVTFYESSKPQVVEPPDVGDGFNPEDLDAPPGMAGDSTGHSYGRQASTDSGWDNPFRPDGDLSREADEIVELIKGGKPITTTPDVAPATEAKLQNAHSSPVTSTPQKNGANGNATGKDKSSPGAVDVQRGTVATGDSAQVEHVTLKKKPKGKCCTVQ